MAVSGSAAARPVRAAAPLYSPHVTRPNSDVPGAAAVPTTLPDGFCDIVGRGRMGEALTSALEETGAAVRGPFGRDYDGDDAALVLLCVPEREIAAAAARIVDGPIVGHVSASAPLDLLAPHERFTLHPLISVLGAGTHFAGAICAIDGSTPTALSVARAVAGRLEMRPIVVRPADRALYHAAASAASNFLVTLEGMAETLAAQIGGGGGGLDRAALAPLVRATVDNWVERGAAAALTGPIARGDDETVARQRAAVSESAPELLPLWDALATATRQLAAAGRVAK